MIRVYLEEYILIKIIIILVLHSLLLVERELNQSITKQRIRKTNGQPQTSIEVYWIQEENFEK